MHNRRLPVLLVSFALIHVGCLPGEFRGAENRVGFNANLGSPWKVWTPSTPVAVGSDVTISVAGAAVSLAEDDYEPVDAVWTPSLGAGSEGTLRDVVLAEDLFMATAAYPGEVEVNWAGPVDDRFTLQVRDVAGGRFIDPVREAGLHLDILDEEALAAGRYGPDIESPLMITAGERLTLGAQLIDADGNELGSDGPSFSARSGGRVAHATKEHATTVTAPSTAGASDVVALLHRGAEVGAVEVIAASPADAASVELGVFNRLVMGVKATVRLADGSVLWQPPITWQLDPRIVALDQASLGAEAGDEPFDPTRSDLVLLQRADESTDALDAEVIARVGEIEERITVTFAATRSPEPPPMSERPEQVEDLWAMFVTSCLGCASSDPAGPVVLGVLALLRRPRLRRRGRPFADGMPADR